MKTGDKAVITITGIAAGGDGVGRVDGAVVFVPGTCRGDVAEIQIEYVRSGCFYGRVLHFLEASPHHRTDFCENCDACGGCNFVS